MLVSNTLHEDAATFSRGRIARDGAVDQDERAAIHDTAALAVWSRGRIARDGAIDQGKRTLVVNAATRATVAVCAGCCIAGDGTVKQGCLGMSIENAIGDAAALIVCPPDPELPETVLLMRVSVPATLKIPPPLPLA